MGDIVKGETVIVRQEYNLFDNEMINQEGIYVKTSPVTGKHLVYFPQVEEWGELEEVERKHPGEVEEKNVDIVGRIRTLEYTADEKLRKEKET
tara:strand:+ start:245 stop:523 length:279 start_codon:yes stop_codon:yes gene_type:complete